MAYILCLIYLLSPLSLWGQDFVTNNNEDKGKSPISYSLKGRELQAIAREKLKTNPKSFWWKIGLMNQIEVNIILPPVGENIASAWSTTIIDFKLGRTSALYFYAQLRLGAIMGGVLPTDVGDTSRYSFGGLVGAGGKYGEMLIELGKRNFVISSYINGGFLLESKRYQNTAILPYFAFEINNYIVFESIYISGTVGYSLGLDVRMASYPGDYGTISAPILPMRTGIQIGLMF